MKIRTRSGTIVVLVQREPIQYSLYHPKPLAVYNQKAVRNIGQHCIVLLSVSHYYRDYLVCTVRIATLRKIDFIIGLPLCIALSGMRWIKDFLVKKPSPSLHKILFVKLAEQGSTVLAAKALEHASTLVEEKNLFFLCFKENRFILDALEIIPSENVLTINHKNLWSLLYSGFSALLKLWRKDIDCAVDFEFFSRSSALAVYLSGAKRRVGFHPYCSGGPYRGDLLTDRMIYNPYLHTSQSFLSLVQILNEKAETLPAVSFSCTQIKTEPKQYQPSAQKLQAMQELLRQKNKGTLPSNLVLLNANCSDMLPLRRWATKNYAALASCLLKHYQEIHIAFTGTTEESTHIDELLRQISSPRCFSLAGQTTLEDLLTLYTISEVLVTNDSGPAHFAALAQIDVITLFGPETPALFGSLSPRSHILWAGLACSPCVSAFNNRTSKCKHNLCMQHLSVQEVFLEVCRVYEIRCKDKRKKIGSSSISRGKNRHDGMEDEKV